jgi:hypothetical protein
VAIQVESHVDGRVAHHAPFGQSMRRSLSVLRTSGARGMCRFPAFDFGGSIWPQASARWRT